MDSQTPALPPISARDNKTPWYITTSLLAGALLVYCHFSYPEFWALLEKNPGKFIGYIIASLVYLPISAAIAAAVWLVSSKLNKKKVFSFSRIWVISTGIVVATILISAEYAAEKERKLESDLIQRVPENRAQIAAWRAKNPNAWMLSDSVALYALEKDAAQQAKAVDQKQ